MSNKNLLLTLALIVSALVLTACQPPTANESEVPEITLPKTNNSNTADTSNLVPQEDLTMPTTEPVKSLRDFAPIEGDTVLLETTKGPMTLKLYTDQVPLTTTNFLTLVSQGFYDGMVFHRVIEDFMAQVGDPKTKDPALQAEWGTGGPGYTIGDEIVPELKHDREGLLSMANTGAPNSGGSQIFMTFVPTPWLDGKHAVFGEITEGLEVLRSLEQGDKIVSAKIQ